MSDNFLENLLAVKWYDGLLVSSGHLEHIDRRLDGLVTEACGALMEQPGLIGQEPGGRTPNQLIAIESQIRDGDEFNLTLNITRGFQALAPGGRIVVGVSNTQARFGVPVTTIHAKLSAKGQADGDFLVCARQVEKDDAKIEKKTGEEAQIELGYPGLGIDLVEIEDFKQRASTAFSDYVVIGLVSLVDGELVVDAEYVPPVVRLESVGSFDDGLVPSVVTLFHDLFRLSVDLVRTSTVAFSQGQVGADLISRRSDYEALRAFLLTKIGVIRNINRISPIKMLLELVFPVATWWRHYYEQQFKQAVGGVDQTPVKRVFDLANVLTDTSYADLCAGSGNFLRNTKKFVEGLNQELGMIG